ncbi:7-carboxy-7-deazaguanine synthase (Cx14CxxC type) [Sinobacterium caligoides]|uniref:7-carboxy-7-deazaguanine synthase n=1 Tax=Sinobacterium caligoides TaxID=933926 RepID=A0A3N2DE34_9GAMM|nr:7-carboxy-7-deazaguanine synthase [Sinobacterium caligoides]ROR97987.1 7-carboxy-7-deazaguanine synthase (Cx14CxxC type) [Sinobacterium caligoides]
MAVYSVKEMFYTLQGEGAQAGRPAIFCRFSGCNLWTGREQDRASADCRFCDTDFIGTDGVDGGKFRSADALADAITGLWPSAEVPCFVVITGGEPALQLDEALVTALHQRGCVIAIETNGTLPLPAAIDWVCISPKQGNEVVLRECDELKVVYPQQGIDPADYLHIQAQRYYISPENDPHAAELSLLGTSRYQEAIDYCLQHPQWRLNLQQHKVLNIA